MGEAATADRARLPAHPRSVGTARALVRKALARAGRDDLAEAAELAVSEVVTNAVVHAGTEVDLEVLAGGDGVRVEVGDGSGHAPAMRNYSSMAGTGRGLRMLEDLVDRWGTRPNDDRVGKVVWFELGSGAGQAAAQGSAADQEREPRADPPVLRVELRRVPILLHHAWQVHAQSLLRELLLSRLDEDDVAHELEQHAAATDAITLLGEHLPPPELGADPESLMVEVAEPRVTRDRVELPVPIDSVPHFELLSRRLDAARGMAARGELLTVPTPPEIRDLRRWLCGQVVSQSRGESPVAWVPPAEDARADYQPLPDAVAALAQAPYAVVAADTWNRIVAVSRGALDLLGYSDAQQLVGRRLIAIIPQRYRQAHLAGFTLHQASGRSPLLRRRVVVPVLRADGTEVAVQLEVDRQEAGEATLFVGHLEQAG